jgi:hypothetical protein
MKVPALLLFSAILVVPTSAFSEVKVQLKNGRTLTADFCEEAGGLVTCSKMGGTFDLEKKDILEMREISEGDGESLVAPSPEDKGDLQGEGKAGEGEALPERTIEEIGKRKSEIAPEREKLLKEREQLQEDLKKAPEWMPVKQYEELQKRNAELDKKIKQYNEEVGRLNQEEKNIVGESGKKKD